MERELGVDGVFDIETENWDRFVLGGFVNACGEYFSTRDPDELATRILTCKGDVWAHNGGRYDALWLCDVLLRWRTTDVQVFTAGSRITLLEVGETRVRDSYALIPMRLEKAAPLGGMKKSDLGFECECGEGCGGYCAIRVGMPESKYRLLDEYLENDCRATYAMVRAVMVWLEEHGFEPRGTVGGTAWASAKKELGLSPARWTDRDYLFAREGYYGGRVEVFRPVARSGHRYDRNSSYPAALCETAIPYGPKHRETEKAGASYASGKEGIYQATVQVSDCFVPPLPKRIGSLAYPTGRFSGCWTGVELRYAESCGVKIDEIQQALVWDRVGTLLEPWCRRVWELRHNAMPVWAAWIKWLANALTGKLAQHPERDEVRIGDEPTKPRKARWDALGPSHRIWRRSVWRIPSCGHVQWSAYLTASARIELHKQMLEAGDDLLYCDTDSVYSRRELQRNLGQDLGQWKYEGPMTRWRAWAPKLYRYTEKSGAHLAAKGLSGIDDASLARFAVGEPWVLRKGVVGFFTSARAGGALFRRNYLARVSHADGEHFGSRVLGQDGRTFACDYESLTGDIRLISSGEKEEGE